MITWRRGVHLPPRKEPAASRNIAVCVPAGPVLSPLSYGEAIPCTPAAEPGALVTAGSLLGLPGEKDGLPAAASITGIYEGVQTLSHPVFGEMTCAVLRPAEAAGPADITERNPEELTVSDILEAARLGAIIDELDGVPLYWKLQEWSAAHVDVLVADGVEAEPYASSAWAVLNQSAEEVWTGLRLAARAVDAHGCHVAVQLPPGRRRPLAQRLGQNAVRQTAGRYPVPRPVFRVGVQACLALYRAAVREEAQIGCVLTVAGDAVANPQNVRVPFGVSVGEVLRFCGLSSDPEYVILGDAMTGVAADSLDTPVLPGVTCLLGLVSRPVPKTRPCMGCGRCAKVCHAGLLPYEIVRRLENMHYERLLSLQPGECDGCGACSHVCPAGRDVTAKVLEAGQTQGTIFLNWGDDDDA